MIKANFNSYNTYITDSLYQWDINQTLSVSGLNLSVAPEVHFSNANMDRAIVRQASMSNHVVNVDIPNSLLQSPLTIRAHIGIYEGSTFKVIEKVEIPVKARTRPLDYVIETAGEEIYSFKALENALANKADSAVINARVDNIIAHNNDSDGNTELIDIRTGADGKTYGSAGEAVRKQVSEINKIVFGKTITNDSETQKTYNPTHNVIELVLNENYPEQQRLTLKYTSLTADVNANSVGYLGITNSETEEEIAPYVTLKYNEEMEIVTPCKVSKLRLYVTEVMGDGELLFTIKNSNPFEDIKKLTDKVTRFQKTIGIIGDSYSAYKNWIEKNYTHWYADEGNVQTNDISDVSQMWWYKLCVETNRTLLRNCSFSGTTICNTGENGIDVSETSFIGRMATDFGITRTLEVKPDEIFIFGGTNDTWLNAPVGSVKYENWSANDLKSVLPAFCYLIDYIRKYNPGVKIYNIANDILSETIKNGMKTACEHYDIINIELVGIDKTNGHPNTSGMEAIKTQIINAI